MIDNFLCENYVSTTGLTINTTGGKLNYQYTDDEEENYNQTYQLKYLEIPLGLKLRSADLRRMNIYGRFGLSPQINIQANDNNDKSISDEIRLFELGYHLGGGIEYAINSSNALMFGLLFNNGFTDITKNKDFDDKAILNRFVFEIGFIF
jgi:opacity protein-like surface antigen